MEELQKIIGYNFKNDKLLRQALTHSSYANEKRLGKNKDYERLEFLGDAVLEMLSSDFIYEKFKGAAEGDLTKYRAALVSTEPLSQKAREINLGKFILLGKGEEKTNGRDREKILEDVTEALIGAIYKDGGIAAANRFIMQFVLNDTEHIQITDHKTQLQEIVQAKLHSEVVYTLVNESGADHNKTFTVKAFISGKAYGTGTGHNLKAAEQQAAEKTIQILK